MAGLGALWEGLTGGRKKEAIPDISELDFVALDTETTGLDPSVDRILSIGALRIRGGRIQVQDALELYLAQEHFDQRSVPIHGILRQGDHERIPEREALLQLKAYTEGAVLVGHHVGFDLEMVRQALRRHGLPPLQNPALDTGLLYRHTLLKTPLLRKKEHYTLDELAEKFDLSCKDRHTALGDAYITALAFLKILTRLKEKKELTLPVLLRLGS